MLLGNSCGFRLGTGRKKLRFMEGSLGQPSALEFELTPLTKQVQDSDSTSTTNDPTLLSEMLTECSAIGILAIPML